MATQQHRSKYDVSMKTLYNSLSPNIFSCNAPNHFLEETI